MSKPAHCSKVDSLPKGTPVIVHGSRLATIHFWRFNHTTGTWFACVSFASVTESNPHQFANVKPADVKRAPKSAGKPEAYVPPNGASIAPNVVYY
jgi:hypothetical protein